MLLTLISQALKIIVCAEGVGIGLGSRGGVHKEVAAASTLHRGVTIVLGGLDAPAVLVHGPERLHSLSSAGADEFLMYCLRSKVALTAEARLETRLPVRRSCRKTSASS